MNFKELGVIDRINDSLIQKNYLEPTPIQKQTIPIALEGRDVLASAQTGTGKTAAFSIPIIQMLNENYQEDIGRIRTKALIMTPTRELALQIHENIKVYSKYTKVKSTVIFGGVKQGSQINSMKKGVHIIIATPGRLLDMMSQGIISLSDIKYFVLDEADRMLDMGFIHDIKKVIKKLPIKRQSFFFSATLPNNIIELSKEILNKPEKISVDSVSSAATTISQKVYYTNKADKKKLLLHILEDESLDHVLIFSRTKHGADRLNKELKKTNIKTDAIHGDKAQNRRQEALSKFKKNEIRVLVATDIAARGLDISNLPYVINYDIPEVSETYVHRIGRTGRAGLKGVSISLCEPEENRYINSIEKLIGEELEEIKGHPYPQTDLPMTKKEKAVFEKEKLERKRQFFANKNKKKR